jgi:hypothetical protein
MFEKKRQMYDKIHHPSKKGVKYTSSRERELAFLRQNLPKDKLEELQFR